MSHNDTLARRLVRVLTLAVALFVGLMAILAYSVMFEQEDELADQFVQIEMGHLLGRLERGEVDLALQPQALGHGFEAWIGDAAVARMPEPLRGLAPGLHEVKSGGRAWHVLDADTEKGRVSLVFDATLNERRVAEFGTIMLVLWAACVGAGYALARVTARLVVGPMREVTARIAAWDPDIASADAPAVTRGDEAGRLLEAFNRMQDRVDRSMARQREFAANLAHEVRTPLAGLRTDIEIGTLHAVADERQRRMLRAVDDITATIAAARALGQAHIAPSPEPVDLHEAVDEVVANLAARAEVAGLAIVNAVAVAQQAILDRYALKIVLRNIVGNAVEHAAPGRLTIRGDTRGLDLADDGPGIAADVLPFVFERHYHGRLRDRGYTEVDSADGHGLGLAIAWRVCEQQGWFIDVESATQGVARGTVFHLRFDGNST